MLNPTPTMYGSWVNWAVDGMEHVVHMLTAAAASDTAAPASAGPLAATAGGAGSGVQHGPQPATEQSEAAAASRAATQRMMDALVPMELTERQSHVLRDTDSSYSGAAAMRPLREWLAMRGAQFGPELVAAIILRYD